MNDYLANKS